MKKLELDMSQFEEAPKSFEKTKGAQIIKKIDMEEINNFEELLFKIREVNDGKSLSKPIIMKLIKYGYLNKILTMQPNEYEAIIGVWLEAVRDIYKGRELIGKFNDISFDEEEYVWLVSKFDIMDYEKKNLGIYFTYDETKKLRGLPTFQSVTINEKWEKKEFFGVITSVKHQTNKYGGHPEIELYISDGISDVRTAINKEKNDCNVTEDMQHKVVFITAKMLDDIIIQEDEDTGEQIEISKRKMSIIDIQPINEMQFVAKSDEDFNIMVDGINDILKGNKLKEPKATDQFVEISFKNKVESFRVELTPSLLKAMKNRSL